MAYLYDYISGAFLRVATKEELNLSILAAESDGGCGLIVVDNVTCFVV